VYEFHVIFEEIWEIYRVKWNKIVLCATFVFFMCGKTKKLSWLSLLQNSTASVPGSGSGFLFN